MCGRVTFSLHHSLHLFSNIYPEQDPRGWIEFQRDKLIAISRIGDVAQMVERMLSMHEALGSIPSFSTLFFNFLYQAEAAPMQGD